MVPKRSRFPDRGSGRAGEERSGTGCRPQFRGGAAALLLFVTFGTPGLAGDVPPEIVVASYNVRNYLIAERPDSGGEVSPKPEKEIAALLRVIRDIKPDVLGICEMGPPEQFEDFRGRLRREGLEYPETEYVAGPDSERHLALLSRYPIIARNSVTDAAFTLRGRRMAVQRGFLDVTLGIGPAYRVRLVGVHLKSRRPVPEGEALIRRNESHLLRAHIDRILKEDPGVNLLVYGDFNDTKNEPTIQAIAGVPGTPGYMADLFLQDSSGDRWTYFWKTADVYSRIDYFFASPGLMPEVVRSRCRIYRSSYWLDASDHRPIMAAIRCEEKRR